MRAVNVFNKIEINIASNLTALMQARNLSTHALAKDTGLPQPTIFRLINHLTADPRISTVKILADYFMITVDQLISADSPGIADIKTSFVKVPLFTWSELLATNNIINAQNAMRFINIDEKLNASCFALESTAQMAPLFPSGSILVVDPFAEIVDGYIVLVYYKKQKTFALREINIDGAYRFLVSVRQQSTQEKITENSKISGVVIQSRFNHLHL